MNIKFPFGQNIEKYISYYIKHPTLLKFMDLSPVNYISTYVQYELDHIIWSNVKNHIQIFDIIKNPKQIELTLFILILLLKICFEVIFS